MFFRPLAAALIASAFATCAASAQEAVDPAATTPEADLATLRTRANERRQGMDYFLQMASMLRQNVILAEGLSGMVGMPYDPSVPDLAYGILDQIKVAQGRADRYAAILSNDLDGDGSVTRDEIAATLKYGQSRRGGAAETMIAYDADENNILSPDEIMKAVSEADGEARARRMNYVPAEIVDFDDDGVVTEAEMKRATAALSLDAALQ